MDGIKSWGMLLLFISAGCFIYYFLLPSGNISKTARSILGITVLSVVCIPVFSVTDFLGNFDPEFGEPPAMISPDDYLRTEAENEINRIIENTVKNFTDISYKTEISIDINEETGINIEQIRVLFEKRPEKLREIKEALYEALSMIPDVKVEREDE